MYSIVKKDDLLTRLQPAQLSRPSFLGFAMPSCFGLTRDLLTVKQVAQQLKVSQRTVWRYVSRKRLPAPVRLSSARLRWRQDDIDTFLERMTKDG